MTITEAELKEIINALSNSKEGGEVNTLFCNNLHYYFVSDCGNPIESANCPDCKCKIGDV